ncbi:hypothetical protein CPB85DRAFT_1328776 [Mucidula mucida]|nr:hypothetical protein CPB85DRAFT_1328776 [Mucidula mucida]
MAESAPSHIGLCAQCHNDIPFAGTPYIPPFYKRSGLRAFCTPSESDVRAIEKDLLARSAEPAALAAKIDRIETLLRTLKDRHTCLTDNIARARQFISPSPIRGLPTENSTRYEMPITLAVVCSQWRDILLKTPSLWTVIHLGSRKCSPAVVDHQLSLSADLPLIVHIQDIYHGRPPAGAHDVYEETEEYFKAVLSRVCQALPRWKDICLQMPLDQLRPFETLLQGALQAVTPQGQSERNPITPKLLEIVRLTVPHVYDVLIYLPKIFESAPKLTTFRYSNEYGYRYSGTSFWPVRGLPWKQLETIIFEHADLHVLDSLPADFFSDGKKAELQLYVQDLLSFGRPGAASIVTSNFTTLRLAPEYWNDNLARYLEAISAPTLKEIEVGCVMHARGGWRKTTDDQNNIGYPNILGALFAMITRSKCLITAFSFYVIGDGPERVFDDSFARAIISLLYLMPELETLEIREAGERGPLLLSDPDFFELCSAPEMGGILPKLESLKLVWAADRQPSADLVPMLQSRMAGSALKSVVLGIRKGGELQFEVLDCMGQMKENGIRATLW